MSNLSILQRITATGPELRKSEKKVADFVSANPQDIVHMRIVDLASQATVSEPTVVRFCRALGFDGFQSFKLALAQEMASNPRISADDVYEWDSLEDTTRKVFDSTIEQLMRMRDRLVPHGSINLAVTTLTNAKRVDFYGFGASAAVAADAQHKFFRLMIPTAYYSDPHLQTMAALSLTQGDVVVAISHSGRTRALIKSLDKVHVTGATSIAIAPQDSPVAKSASICIPIDTIDDTRIYAPVTSRITQMVLIDALAIGVAQHRGEKLERHLAEIHTNLENLRVDTSSD